MARAGIGDRLEGLHAVAAAVAAGRVRRLFIERQRLRHDEYQSLADAVRDVRKVDDVRDDAVTSTPQGVVAHCDPIATISLGQAIKRTEPASLVILDRLQDPRNIGAIARSAWAAGIGAIVVPERRAAPVGATAFKAAAGALEHVPVVMVGSVADAMRSLRKAGVWLVGLDGSAQQPLFGLSLLSEPVALVIGAEGTGIAKLTGDHLDTTVRIPMAEGVESLNASVAASLAMFEIARVRSSID